jgi:hypothetical protein
MTTPIHRRAIAAAELLLISPAALFMAALVVRALAPQPHPLAHAAQQIVMWYAGRLWTLWLLLLALPMAALISGCATLLGSRNNDPEPPHASPHSLAAFRAHPATLVIAAATFAAAGILVIVVLHMLAN